MTAALERSGDRAIELQALEDDLYNDMFVDDDDVANAHRYRIRRRNRNNNNNHEDDDLDDGELYNDQDDSNFTEEGEYEAEHIGMGRQASSVLPTSQQKQQQQQESAPLSSNNSFGQAGNRPRGKAMVLNHHDDTMFIKNNDRGHHQNNDSNDGDERPRQLFVSSSSFPEDMDRRRNAEEKQQQMHINHQNNQQQQQPSVASLQMPRGGGISDDLTTFHERELSAAAQREKPFAPSTPTIEETAATRQRAVLGVRGSHPPYESSSPSFERIAARVAHAQSTPRRTADVMSRTTPHERVGNSDHSHHYHQSHHHQDPESSYLLLLNVRRLTERLRGYTVEAMALSSSMESKRECHHRKYLGRGGAGSDEDGRKEFLALYASQGAQMEFYWRMGLCLLTMSVMFFAAALSRAL